MQYPIKVTPEDGAFNVELIDLSGFTFGSTLEEALSEAEDCLFVALAGAMAHGKEIPEPSADGDYFVELSPTVGLKVELYRAWRAVGISKAELARRLGWSPTQVQRLFDLHHVSKLEQLHAAFRALGRRLIVTTAAEDVSPPAAG